MLFQTERFECNFGPNYHATFEVFVNVDTEEVRLSLSDETEGKEVWLPRRILFTGNESITDVASIVIFLTHANTRYKTKNYMKD